MKRILVLLLGLFISLSFALAQEEKMIERIHWLGQQSSIYIDGESVKVYIDPYGLKEALPAADIILITHAHSDHFSESDIKKVYKPGTVIIAPQSVAKQSGYKIKVIKPGDSIIEKGINIEVVFAYNTNKAFHQKSDDFVGYIITVDNTRIYHVGDTDFIPEMRQIKADICLLPVGGTYTMTASEAAEAANAIMPKAAIPMHYGTIVGTDKDAQDFKKLTKSKVVILKRE